MKSHFPEEHAALKFETIAAVNQLRAEIKRERDGRKYKNLSRYTALFTKVLFPTAPFGHSLTLSAQSQHDDKIHTILV